MAWEEPGQIVRRKAQRLNFAVVEDKFGIKALVRLENENEQIAHDEESAEDELSV